MNTHKKGFSLIECSVYCCILMILSMMAFEFLARVNSTIHLKNNEIHKALGIHAAHDLLRSDIQQAGALYADWHVGDKSIICKGAQEWYGWLLKGESLYRIKGVYNVNQQQWITKAESLVARFVKVFRAELAIHDGLVRTVSYSLALKTESADTHVIYLINGACL